MLTDVYGNDWTQKFSSWWRESELILDTTVGCDEYEIETHQDHPQFCHDHKFHRLTKSAYYKMKKEKGKKDDNVRTQTHILKYHFSILNFFVIWSNVYLAFLYKLDKLFKGNKLS